MQPTRVVVLGGSATGVLWYLSHTTNGLLSASAFLLTFFAAAITIALLLVSLIQLPHGYFTSLPHVGDRCGECGRGLAPLGAVWVCDRCDTAYHDSGRVRFIDLHSSL